MTRKQALIGLRDKVMAGDADDFGSIKPGWPIYRGYAESAFRGSLDAAKALHEAVLPGWDWCVTPKGSSVYSADDNSPYDCDDKQPTPARAWLLAILEALIAQEGDA